MRRRLLFALVAASAVALAVAVSAVAAETPFKGTVNAVETGQTVFPIRSIDREGTGTATYLGKYTRASDIADQRHNEVFNRCRDVHGSER